MKGDDSVHEYHGDWIGVRKERVTFLQHELESISKNFASLIEGPQSQNITQKLFKEVSKTYEMEALLNKYDEKTLLSKVRTERKKYIASLK